MRAPHPFGLTAIDLARTEVGLIIIAVDYDPGKISPWDLSMDRFIKTDTECVGAAALAERGANPPKRFKTLKIEGDVVPEYGATVTKDGRDVGVVTSPASSPRLGTIGLAILDADVAGDGEKVEVAVEGGTAPASVEVLSLLDPEKRAAHGPDRRPPSGLASRTSRGAGLAPRPVPMLDGMRPRELYGVVPNFSEGRRADVVEAIVDALRVPGVRVVFAEADPDHNRLDTTVLGGRRGGERRARSPGRPSRST